MTLGIDGIVGQHFSAQTSYSISFSNAFINDVITVQFVYSTTPISGTSVSDTAGLNWVQRIVASHGSQTEEIWYAISPNQLTNDIITASLNGQSEVGNLVVFGINGAYTFSGNPFDTNSSLPDSNNGSSSNPSITGYSTNYAQTMLLLFLMTADNPTVTSPAGFTPINPTNLNPPTTRAYYQIVSSSQSSLTETFTLSVSAAWALVGDAIVMGQLLMYLIQIPV